MKTLFFTLLFCSLLVPAFAKADDASVCSAGVRGEALVIAKVTSIKQDEKHCLLKLQIQNNQSNPTIWQSQLCPLPDSHAVETTWLTADVEGHSACPRAGSIISAAVQLKASGEWVLDGSWDIRESAQN